MSSSLNLYKLKPESILQQKVLEKKLLKSPLC